MYSYIICTIFLKSNNRGVANLLKDIEQEIDGAGIQTKASFKASIVFPHTRLSSSLYMYQI